ncbi:hypothetical protein CAQU_01215 [Corynebacterium aquilae DSM 44791]|uniref:Uncharacterized protein n=2 Tax=Corynebacterium aquilae TaxID=203263 RepID=A0A1L7CDJ4_9CORY|nr:hypothetical protein CAQU_01215 [Corynebacterium aquilae DSM 44791]
MQLGELLKSREDDLHSGFINGGTNSDKTDGGIDIKNVVLRFSSPEVAQEVAEDFYKVRLDPEDQYHFVDVQDLNWSAGNYPIRFQGKVGGLDEKLTIPVINEKAPVPDYLISDVDDVIASFTHDEYFFLVKFTGRSADEEFITGYMEKAYPKLIEGIDNAQTQKTKSGYGKVDRIRNADKGGLLRLSPSFQESDKKTQTVPMPAVMNKRQAVSTFSDPRATLEEFEEAGVTKIARNGTMIIETSSENAAAKLYEFLRDGYAEDGTLEEYKDPQGLPNTTCFEGINSKGSPNEECIQQYGRYVVSATGIGSADEDPDRKQLRLGMTQRMAAQYLIFKDAEGKDLTAE